MTESIKKKVNVNINSENGEMEKKERRFRLTKVFFFSRAVFVVARINLLIVRLVSGVIAFSHNFESGAAT